MHFTICVRAPRRRIIWITLLRTKHRRYCNASFLLGNTFLVWVYFEKFFTSTLNKWRKRVERLIVILLIGPNNKDCFALMRLWKEPSPFSRPLVCAIHETAIPESWEWRSKWDQGWGGHFHPLYQWDRYSLGVYSSASFDPGLC